MKKILLLLMGFVLYSAPLQSMQNSFLQRNKYTIAGATVGLSTLAGLTVFAYKNPEKIGNSLETIQQLPSYFSNGMSTMLQTLYKTPASIMQATGVLKETYANTDLYCVDALPSCFSNGMNTVLQTLSTTSALFMQASSMLKETCQNAELHALAQATKTKLGIATTRSLGIAMVAGLSVLANRSILQPYLKRCKIQKEQELEAARLEKQKQETLDILKLSELVLPVTFNPKDILDVSIERERQSERTIEIAIYYKELKDVIKAVVNYDIDTLQLSTIAKEKFDLGRCDVIWMRKARGNLFIFGCADGCYYKKIGTYHEQTYTAKIGSNSNKLQNAYVIGKQKSAFFYISPEDPKKIAIFNPETDCADEIALNENIRQICAVKHFQNNALLIVLDNEVQTWVESPIDESSCPKNQLSKKGFWKRCSISHEKIDTDDCVLGTEGGYLVIKPHEFEERAEPRTSYCYSISLNALTACSNDEIFVGIDNKGNLIACSKLYIGLEVGRKYSLLRAAESNAKIIRGRLYTDKRCSFYFGTQEDGQSKMIFLPTDLELAQEILPAHSIQN